MNGERKHGKSKSITGRIKRTIRDGRAVLGIELGSTTIKAVLIGEDHMPVASGSHGWENQLDEGIWTYSLEAIWTGLQDAYQKLRQDVQEKYGRRFTPWGPSASAP